MHCFKKKIYGTRTLTTNNRNNNNNNSRNATINNDTHTIRTTTSPVPQLQSFALTTKESKQELDRCSKTSPTLRVNIIYRQHRLGFTATQEVRTTYSALTPATLPKYYAGRIYPINTAKGPKRIKTQTEQLQ